MSKAGFCNKIELKVTTGKEEDAVKLESMEDEREKEKKASSKSVAILSSSKREADVLISASQCGSISYLEHKKEHPNS